MISELVILGRTVPVYGLIGIFGICLSLAYALFSCKRFGLSRDDTLYIFVFGCIGAAVGAKLLYLLVSAEEIYRDIISGDLSMQMIAVKYISGGMVFYGGFIGALIAGRYVAGTYGKNIVDFFPVLVPGFALAHGIARLGCLLVGCCYGIPTTGRIAVVYHSSQIAPDGVPLIPVQGMEALGEIIIFFVLIYISRHTVDRARILYAYILMYAPMRFCMEFLRGDEARGAFMFFSVSQWISLLLIAAVVIRMYIRRKEVQT